MNNYKKKTNAEYGELSRALTARDPRPANKPAPDYQMHEFPFNRTQQANEFDSSVEYVDAAQNGLQGTYFSWVIRKKLKSADGAAFIVVPIPDVVLPD